jgi:hypothetical protein
VSAFGLGCIGKSGFFRPADEAERIVCTLADACPRRRPSPPAAAEALGALELDLSGDDLAPIERAIPVGAAAGER